MSSPSTASTSATAPAALPFSPATLEAWLKAQLPSLQGPMRLEAISGGQSNPTYFVSFANRELVLRKQPPGELLPSAHAVDRECRVIRALAGTPVPVPEAVLFCEDRTVMGTPFYVMQRLHGRVFPILGLPQVAAQQRRPMVLELMRTLAALHQVQPAAVGLADYGKPGSYFERQVGRWSRQWEATAAYRTKPNEDMQRLLKWLPAHLPPGEAATIVHGDFRLGNVMFSPDLSKIIGVLDWELSTLGHPLADVSYCCMPWLMAASEFDGVAGMDLNAMGLPSLGEALSTYRHAGGCQEPLQPFHFIFSMFRMAVILDGVRARGLAGNASSANAAEVGGKADSFAARAAKMLDEGVPGLG